MGWNEDQQALAWQQIIKNRAFYNVRVRRGESWVDAACRTLDELVDQKEQAEKSLEDFISSQLNTRDDKFTQLDEARRSRGDRPVNAYERIARAWHKGSDHAKDGTPFGGPLCNCWQVAGRIMPMLAEAWAAGYEDCFDFYARGNTPPRTRNPYGPEDRHVDQ